MTFRNPGGGLSWFTAIMALAGPFVAWIAFQVGSLAAAVFYLSLAVLSALVWLDAKWVATPLMFYFAFGLVAGIILLFVRGFEWRMMLKIVFVVCSIFELREWQTRVGAEVEREDDTGSSWSE